MLFGQVVIGPPGAGKTTYCLGMEMYLQSVGRECGIINVDFANDCASLPYTPLVDCRELIRLEDAMELHELGPNGGLVYCMEYLEVNIDWLVTRLENVRDQGGINYVVFDFPGQVELYTHYTCVYNIIDQLNKRLDARLCSVYLIDSFCCCDPNTFISALLLVTSTMLRIALPHVNVLSKIDLLPLYGQLPFNLDFYTEVQDISRILRYMDDPVGTRYDEVNDSERDYELPSRDTPIHTKFKRMTSKICEVVEDLQLVDFLPLNIQDAETVTRVVATVDKANGFYAVSAQAKDMKAYNKYEASYADAMKYLYDYGKSSTYNNLEPLYSRSLDIQERYTSSNDVPIAHLPVFEAMSKKNRSVGGENNESVPAGLDLTVSPDSLSIDELESRLNALTSVSESLDDITEDDLLNLFIKK